MTRLVNDAESFARDALAGYAAADPGRVVLVDGGVVRADEPSAAAPAVVMGGGSGHYPAFAGWVGRGLVSGAACGNVFASPSAAQIARVARAAHSGGGILFIPINYAGDILHFGEASAALAADGLDVRTVVVADDIASAPPEHRDSRRGIAGAFIVAKIAGAAAESGDALDAVERIARRAADAVRTFGAAFSGCTLPGAAAPLFEIPPGRVALGLGIHGEPGLSERDLTDADSVVDLLVDGLLAERPAEPGRRVAVLVNGLGATSMDELHLAFARTRRRLEEAGMTLVAPVVGSQVTSLDMAGISLSIAYLDDELERLWTAAADAASFHRDATTDAGMRRTVDTGPPIGDVPIRPAGPDSRRAARDGLRRASRALAAIRGEAANLGALDAVGGDGDHGTGMVRGLAAAVAAWERAVALDAGAGTALQRAGQAWSEVAGGTSGALWGTGLVAAGAVVGDEGRPDDEVVREAVAAFASAVTTRGGAAPGDKTLVDALLPFQDALADAIDRGEPPAAAWRVAAREAARAAAATAEMVARLGRARTHGDRTLGTPDPGAVSFALVVEAVVAADASR